MRRLRAQHAFSLIELLVVILIIGILAGLALPRFTGQREKANGTKAMTQLALLEKAIIAGRLNTGQTLTQITGQGFTGGACTSNTHNLTSTWPADLPKTHVCWTVYQLSIDRIAAASGINLDEIRSGDANGNPFWIDENEGESTTTPCNADDIGFYIGGKLPASAGDKSFFFPNPWTGGTNYNNLTWKAHELSRYSTSC